MARAQRRDAVRSQKFFFRKDVFPSASSQPSRASSIPSSPISEHGGPIHVNGVTGKEKKLRNCFPLPPMPDDVHFPGSIADEYEEMSMQEIMNGKVRISCPYGASGADNPRLKGTAYPGLLNLVYMYLDTLDVEDEERRRIEEYLDLVRRRTNGTRHPAVRIRHRT